MTHHYLLEECCKLAKMLDEGGGGWGDELDEEERARMLEILINGIGALADSPTLDSEGGEST